MRRFVTFAGIALAMLVALPALAANTCPPDAKERRNKFFDQCTARECPSVSYATCPRPDMKNMKPYNECAKELDAAWYACVENCFMRGTVYACTPEPESSGIFPKVN